LSSSLTTCFEVSWLLVSAVAAAASGLTLRSAVVVSAWAATCCSRSLPNDSFLLPLLLAELSLAVILLLLVAVAAAPLLLLLWVLVELPLLLLLLELPPPLLLPLGKGPWPSASGCPRTAAAPGTAGRPRMPLLLLLLLLSAVARRVRPRGAMLPDRRLPPVLLLLLLLLLLAPAPTLPRPDSGRGGFMEATASSLPLLLLLLLLAPAFPRLDSGRGRFFEATASLLLLLLLLLLVDPPGMLLLGLLPLSRVLPGTCNRGFPPAGTPGIRLAAASGGLSAGSKELGCLTSPTGP
jgi:hypothetical protein